MASISPSQITSSSQLVILSASQRDWGAPSAEKSLRFSARSLAAYGLWFLSQYVNCTQSSSASSLRNQRCDWRTPQYSTVVCEMPRACMNENSLSLTCPSSMSALTTGCFLLTGFVSSCTAPLIWQWWQKYVAPSSSTFRARSLMVFFRRSGAQFGHSTRCCPAPIFCAMWMTSSIVTRLTCDLAALNMRQIQPTCQRIIHLNKSSRIVSGEGRLTAACCRGT